MHAEERNGAVVFVFYFVLACICYTAWESDMELRPPDSLTGTFVFLAGLVGVWYLVRTSSLFLKRLQPTLYLAAVVVVGLAAAYLFAKMLFHQMHNAFEAGKTPLFVIYFTVFVFVFQSCTAVAYEMERRQPRIAHQLFLTNKLRRRAKNS